MSGVTEDWALLSSNIRGVTNDMANMAFDLPMKAIGLQKAKWEMADLAAKQEHLDKPVSVDLLGKYIGAGVNGLADPNKIASLTATSDYIKSIGWKADFNDPNGLLTGKDGKAVTNRQLAQVMPVLSIIAAGNIDPKLEINQQIAKANEVLKTNPNDANAKNQIATLTQRLDEIKKNPESYAYSIMQEFSKSRAYLKTIGADTTYLDERITDQRTHINKLLEKRAEQENWTTLPAKVAKALGVDPKARFDHTIVSASNAAYLHLQGVLAQAGAAKDAAKAQGLFAAIEGSRKHALEAFKQNHFNEIKNQWGQTDDKGNFVPWSSEKTRQEQARFVEAYQDAYLKSAAATTVGKKVIGDMAKKQPTLTPEQQTASDERTKMASLFTKEKPTPEQLAIVKEADQLLKTDPKKAADIYRTVKPKTKSTLAERLRNRKVKEDDTGGYGLPIYQ